MFEVNAVLFAEILLNIFSDSVKSPEYLSDPMVFVNDLIGFFKKSGSQRSIRLPHITDERSYFVSLRLLKVQKVSC